MGMLDAADQEHLAQVRVVGEVSPADPHAVRHVRTLPLRHTDRRPVRGAPVGPDDLRAITTAVQAEGAWLQILKADQVLELAAAADDAQRAEAGDSPWRAELAYWTGGRRTTGAGLPDSVIPQRAAQTDPPARDYGHLGELPIRAEHYPAALFSIPYGPTD